MAVPKKRTSKRRKGMRRSHDHLKYKALSSICKQCGAIKLAHHACPHCGYYRGIQIIKLKGLSDDADGGLEDELD